MTTQTLPSASLSLRRISTSETDTRIDNSDDIVQPERHASSTQPAIPSRQSSGISPVRAQLRRAGTIADEAANLITTSSGALAAGYYAAKAIIKKDGIPFGYTSAACVGMGMVALVTNVMPDTLYRSNLDYRKQMVLKMPLLDSSHTDRLKDVSDFMQEAAQGLSPVKQQTVFNQLKEALAKYPEFGTALADAVASLKIDHQSEPIDSNLSDRLFKVSTSYPQLGELLASKINTKPEQSPKSTMGELMNHKVDALHILAAQRTLHLVRECLPTGLAALSAAAAVAYGISESRKGKSYAGGIISACLGCGFAKSMTGMTAEKIKVLNSVYNSNVAISVLSVDSAEQPEQKNILSFIHRMTAHLSPDKRQITIDSLRKAFGEQPDLSTVLADLAQHQLETPNQPLSPEKSHRLVEISAKYPELEKILMPPQTYLRENAEV
jgi:hypothetical protein